MSTPLKSTKLILETVKTLSHIQQNHNQSTNPHERDFANSIEQLFKDLNLTDADINTPDGRLEHEKALFTYIVNDNIESNISTYEDRVNQRDIDKQKELRENIVHNIHKLNSIVPDINHLTASGLHAKFFDIIHGLDSENHQNKVLHDFLHEIVKFSVKSQPDYTQSSEDLSEIAKGALSVASWGNILLEHNLPLRSSLNNLQTSGSYSNGQSRIFYGSDVFATLLVDLKGKNEDYSSMGYITGIVEHGLESDAKLLSLKELSGLNIRISSDIPKPESSDSFAVAKAMNQLSDKHPSIEPVSRMVKEYNNILATSMIGYKRYYGRDYEQYMDNSPSI
ncbi:hypothetical protein HJ167_21015 [Vibrio parahaemolyticus]|nr:hypothetical protein [Vibrio parahaemolyticus]